MTVHLAYFPRELAHWVVLNGMTYDFQEQEMQTLDRLIFKTGKYINFLLQLQTNP